MDDNRPLYFVREGNLKVLAAYMGAGAVLGGLVYFNGKFRFEALLSHINNRIVEEYHSDLLKEV